MIEAAEYYPTFLPWCASAVILERSESVVSARINVDYRGLRLAFTTRNPKARPHWLQVRLVEGPFRRFEGQWSVKALTPDACKVDFAFGYEFGPAVIGKLASPVFNGIVETLVDAFARRVEQQAAAPPSVTGVGMDNPRE